MHPIREYLYRMVAVQSDSGTEMERNMANVIYDMIRSHPYFASHPEYCGTFVQNDILNRPVVWALKKGTTDKTIILMGHYDTVEIDSYGMYKPYALNPDVLKEKFKEGNFGDESLKAHLEDENWAFGRGIADMKAGIAINMHILFTNEVEEVNILFIALPDEENMSSGAIMSIPLYLELKDKFNLDYKLCIVPEPEEHTVNGDVDIFAGSAGKFMPIIMAKGVPTHAARIMNGLNSGFIIGEIIRNIEICKDMITFKDNIFSQPPSVLLFKDLKPIYDVTVPEYSVALFNFMFLKTRPPMDYMDSIINICKNALDFAVDKYNDTFDYLVREGLVKEENRVKFNPKVMLLSELEHYIKERKPVYKEFREELDRYIMDKVQSKEMTLQEASIHMIKSLLEYSEIIDPVVVIGISPPYYPAVSNDAIPDKNVDYVFENIEDRLREKYGIGLKHYYSNMSMTDISYFSCTNPKEEREFLNNLTVPSGLYDIPVEDIAKLNIPTFKIGPNSRDIHRVGERVYMPDVEELIPGLFRDIIKNLAKSEI